MWNEELFGEEVVNPATVAITKKLVGERVEEREGQYYIVRLWEFETGERKEELIPISPLDAHLYGLRRRAQRLQKRVRGFQEGVRRASRPPAFRVFSPFSINWRIPDVRKLLSFGAPPKRQNPIFPGTRKLKKIRFGQTGAVVPFVAFVFTLTIAGLLLFVFRPMLMEVSGVSTPTDSNISLAHQFTVWIVPILPIVVLVALSFWLFQALQKRRYYGG